MVLKPILHSLLVVELRHLSCFLIFHQKMLQNSNKKHQNDASATKRRVQHGSQTNLSCSASGGNVARVCFLSASQKNTSKQQKQHENVLQLAATNTKKSPHTSQTNFSCPAVWKCGPHLVFFRFGEKMRDSNIKLMFKLPKKGGQHRSQNQCFMPCKVERPLCFTLAPLCRSQLVSDPV